MKHLFCWTITIATLAAASCSTPVDLASEASEASETSETSAPAASSGLAESEGSDDTNQGEPRRLASSAQAAAASACPPPDGDANGDWHHCSAACPCGAGEGDCDGNDECAPGLTCVKDVGPRYGWDEDVDVCEDTCHPSDNGGFHYCSDTCPCEVGEGDCDGDDECAPGLVCAKNVGPTYGWDEDVDVCRLDCAGDACGPEEPSGTSLFLQVLDVSGQPVPSAAITLDGTLAATDGAGRLALEDLAPGRVAVKVEARGHTSASVVVDLNAGAQVGTELRLRPLGPPIPFEAEAGAELAAGGVRVNIPPDALVDFKGEPVRGTVEATVVPLDPSAATIDELPGPLEGQSAADGAVVNLESVAMAEVSLWQDGLPVQLAPGARAILELALPDAVAGQYEIGTQIPAWSLDLDAGVWREEGMGTIQPSLDDPERLAWVVEVGHFTWWNCDRPWTAKHCYAVTVEDVFGNPVPGMQVGAQGVSYTGASRWSFTGADGSACVEAMRDGTANIIVGTASAPLATLEVTGSGPASDCAGSGAACTPVTITLPFGTKICTPGTTEHCPYSGPAGTASVGLCRAGSNQCNATGTAWSGCSGEVLPAEETCATPFDDDCDGASNEADAADCECGFGESVDCYSGPPDTVGVGICAAGTQTCEHLIGRFGACKQEVLPQPFEICETPEDDDCDGSTACPCGDGIPGQVACWPLDESAGNVSAEMVNGNHGTWQGDPTPVPGVRGNALAFDGSGDFVTVPDAPALNVGTGDFSLSFHVKTLSSGLGVIVDKRTEASGPTRGYVAYVSSGRLGFQLADGGFTSYFTNVLVADGQWHHVVITVDRDQSDGLKVYRDKLLVTTNNPTGRQGSLTNPQPFTMGRRSNSSSAGFFNGELDEVKLFDRVLTLAEIEAL